MKETQITPESLPSKQIELIVFDMDGTLYQLDGQNSGFTDSSLEKTIFQNIQRLIILKEGVSEDVAYQIFQKLKDAGNGYSRYFSSRYSITREEYFDHVWNIDPSDILSNFDIPVRVIPELISRGKTLILLTQAPKVWQERVIAHLGLEGAFSKIFTADSYGEKSEIFTLLAEQFDPESIITIGDQYTTDIEPALKLKMKGLHVSSPKDVIKILELV